MAETQASTCPPAFLEKFNPDRIMLSPWLELFDEYCSVFDIPEEPVDDDGNIKVAPNKRRGLFLLHLDAKVYQILHFTCLPQKPSAKTIPQLCQYLRDGYELRSLEMCNRALFNSRMQGPNESTRHFIAAVEELGMKAFLGEFWCDQVADVLINGSWNNVKVRQQLLENLIDEPKHYEKYIRVKRCLMLEDSVRAVMRVPRKHASS